MFVMKPNKGQTSLVNTDEANYTEIVAKYNADSRVKLAHENEKWEDIDIGIDNRPTWDIDSLEDTANPPEEVKANPSAYTMIKAPLCVHSSNHPAWVEPPNRTELSDEDVYLASKHVLWPFEPLPYLAFLS
ncbi:hypothetical protein N7519_003415 [Penicillium mononematosum]|uniref:uncharacterized protein n=1 Tax=Penicillium mononematosum TaxID=268346 RepID=UPI002546DD53|nr:uncharacterized protein N7519_003415 [Penicillium mononematosum]KAJ6188507.1 hypothetical protein N7519_003415 [Penicillium mononematosum]